MNNPKIILIDDDYVANFLNREIIALYNHGLSVSVFENPLAALEYLILENTVDDPDQTILFVDINMPLMTGWQFIELLQTDHPLLLKRLKIYLLSSSIDHNDKNRAAAHPHIADMFSKPIDEALLPVILQS
ncbi:response regulator [Sediminibacterium goheungense]|uniref:Response regulator receiver domain-containing protein n=1 Tax=Sediminibacterium goheungense TaxID=1086393 RepID=A0A4R6J368_9BACT|nr:response regulator [Sediminibacterium goheungense]TDO28615.1 response regulator receiver domain-containing protein [Sediminibacterium goheungense]